MTTRRGGLVAGVDSSTQSTKVVVIDPETGRRVAEARAPHEVAGTGGARESDPEGWWTALASALRATGVASEIGAISVAAQQHGLVTLDGEGRPVRPAVLWNDTRSAPDADDLVAAWGPEAWADRVGSVLVPSFTITRWAWLRRTEPEAARATRAIRLPHDFLTERLTGRAATDRGDASGTGWWSTRTGGYLEDALALPTVDVDPGMLPEVLGPQEPAGTIRAAVAEDLGLPSGTIVGPGTGDNMGAALGLAVGPGEPVMSLGTSGTAYLVSERRAVDPSGVVAGFADATGRFLPLACTLNCTLAVDRVADWLGSDREAVAPSGGVVVLPWFDGERTPNLPGASATIVGLRHASEPGAILMATYEGALAGLLDALDRIGELVGGIPPDAPLTLIGGGAEGRIWQETARRLSGRPVRVPAERELVAVGAAVQAAAVLTGGSGPAIARRWAATSTADVRLDPVPPDHALLERLRRVRDLAAELTDGGDRT
ncbi:MAG TPA: xylulokinase [Candidatus Limnocylindrales bacterium]|nr:xylulokinase [Candidatus Limnocylindrales bacterium]